MTKNLKSSFPSNVYSYLLELDHGGVQYPHLGIFETSQDEVITAQENARRLIFSRLPSTPCRILAIGIGLTATMSQLIQAGYDVVTVTAASHRIYHPKLDDSEESANIHAKLEELTTKGQFDCLVFYESARYFDTSTLFKHATRLLRDGGSIVIMDEVSLRIDTGYHPDLPLLENYYSQAGHLGFECTEHLDLSALVKPTIEYIIDAMARYRDQLPNDLGLDDTTVGGIFDSALLNLHKYHEGRLGYILWRCIKKSHAPKWLPDWAGPADEAELLALFRRAFGNDVSPALWRWKYQGQNPWGTLVRRGDRLVAYYGAIPRKISMFGTEAVAVQLADVMVDPLERGILTRHGPFYLSAELYIRSYVGLGKPFPIGFGFPTQRAWRLGERLGMYGKVGQLMRIDWPALEARPSLKLCARPLKSSQRYAVDQLWLEMAGALIREVIGVRDFNYISHRYLEHPTIKYQVFLVSRRLTRMPFGVVVVRELDGELELMDIVAPPERIPTLIYMVRRLTFRLGKPTVYAWITTQHTNLLSGASGTVSPTNIIIAGIDWPLPMPADIADHWWLMSGDTDFR